MVSIVEVPMNGLRLKQVEVKLGIKKTKIYSLIQEGKLPSPVKIGRASVWIEEEINNALMIMSGERGAT